MSAFSDKIASLAPLGWWRFGESSGTVAEDSSGNDRDGAYTGAVTLGVAANIPGDTVTAVGINTTSQEAHVAYDSAWMNQSGGLCWTIRFKTSKTTRQYLFTRNFSYAGLDIDAGNLARFYVTIAGTLYTLTSAAISGLMSGTWHIMTGRYNGSTIDLFVDGVKLPISQSRTGAVSTNTNGIGFGYRADNTGVNRFVGTLGDAVWLPPTVSDADIIDMHNLALSGPVVAWMWGGAVTDDGFTVSVKTSPGVDVELGVSVGSTLTSPTYGSPVTADSDGYAQVSVTGLAADADHTYGIKLDGTLDPSVGHVTTHPTAGSPTSFEFAHASCIANNSNHRVFDAIRTRSPLMMQQEGDFHYANISTNTPASFRSAYNGQLSTPRISALVAAVPMDYVWDDHDFGADNSNGSSASKPAAQSVYRQLAPHYTLPVTDAIYHTYQIGRVKFIVTDLRSFRDSNGATSGPSKTMLGTTQKAWFKSELDDAAADPDVALVVWISSQVYNTSGTSGINYDADSWASFTNERTELANYIRDAGLAGNMFIVVGDAHMLAHDDGALSDFATGGGAPIPQFCAAALDEVGLVRGPNWSSGTYPGGGQFGYFTFTDDGTTLDWQWEGVRVDPTTGAETIMIDVSGSVASGSGGSGSGLAVSRWDGSTRVPGTLLGRWNGSTIDPPASILQTT